MPRSVDHASRRRQIVEAAWAVVLREGYAGLSVRSVAAEGGWSVGSLRHFFPSQADLVAATTQALGDRVQQRVRDRAATASTPDDLAALVEEVLPLDLERQQEAGVWLALVTASRTDEQVLALTREAHRGLRTLSRAVVEGVAAASGVELDVPMETDRLHALVDGLALHAAVHPEDLSPERIRAALRAHLAQVAQPGRSAHG